ncbi:MAG: histidinol dehydrogenase [Firmicutes bacterium HGW-Firmicutes-9]|jgi:histidinol dehydrogenase|nr:MAG: histidinol dehydrogenase [Firmicutes bacterium HGW-Firmicutes-9]
MKILDYNEIDKSTLFLRRLEDSGVEDVVRGIIADVAENGDSALFAYAKKFDRAELDALEVTQAELDDALLSIPAELIAAMQTAAENIRAFHSMQLREGFRLERPNGVYMGQKITPIEKVGLYIPGGTASYPSTVFMNAIPAKLAGCPLVVMVSPPNANGQIAATILAAAKLAGVDRVFKMGGAQAVAALAYGTESVPKVDKIVGPGNAYVAEAKRQVFGRVAIDMIAGPSEILVVADETVTPSFVAADLLSQAEHDALASAVLITNSRQIADAVSAEVERQLSTLPRETIARASIENHGKIIVTDDLLCAIDLANDLAPEHLELCVKEPERYLAYVKNAGSVFLGNDCPESLGDYLAGPNHTLPTSGTARFSSPLSVDDFVKKTQYTYFSREALAELSDKIAVFARAEGLEAHARAALIRSEENNV